jgi:hypothetical protein
MARKYVLLGSKFSVEHSRPYKNMRGAAFSYCAHRNDALRYGINQGSTTR